MKTITMSALRAEPGEVIRAVQRGGESFCVTKSGKTAALITPDGSESTVVARDGTVRGPAAALLADLGALRAIAGY